MTGRRVTLGFASAVLVFAASAPAWAINPVGPGKRAVADAEHRSRSLRRPAHDEARVRRAIEAKLGSAVVEFDDQTSRPARIWLAGVPVAGATASPAVAEADARARLESLVPWLAPGATAGDFVVVGQDVDALTGLRSVAFVQVAAGHPVYGGQLSFRYAHDRLVGIANDSVVARVRATRSKTLSSEALAAKAKAALPVAHSRVLAVEPPMWFSTRRDGKQPLVLARRIRLETEGPNDEVSVWVAVDGGDVLTTWSDRLNGSSRVTYDVPRRGPAGVRYAAPVANARALVGGVDTVSSADGEFLYPGGQATYAHALLGLWAEVENAAGPNLEVQAQLEDGVAIAYGRPSNEQLDAQLVAYVHSDLVTAYVRNIAPEFDFAQQPVTARVNVDDTCNANWSGGRMNFYQGNDACENTARIADVVYHEYGHGTHINAIVPGVGSFDGAFSEGMSDYLAATMVDDSGMARGFFKGSDEPLRELDPIDFEWTWPDDDGEVHDAGRIIGGAFWDLRERLRAKLGSDEGVTYTDRLWFSALGRAYDIPSAYFEVLLADDDDGDLSNGTPNVCEINESFGAHGLFRIPGALRDLSWQEFGDVSELNVEIELPFALGTNCQPELVPTLGWRLRGEDTIQVQPLVPTGETTWQAQLPTPADDEVLEWRVELQWSVGTTQSYPENRVDPFFERYYGPVIPLYCTGFEDEDEIAGWSFSGGFDVGPLGQPSGAGDPEQPFEGDLALVLDGGEDGAYLAGNSARASSPLIETQGYAKIRLQYYRDLDVEDGFFDQAAISVNGTPVWSNFQSSTDSDASKHHRDRRWRFQDLDISAQANEGSVQIEYSLDSDGGLEFGGWNIDAFCVVAVQEGGRCGDGVVDPGEQCDDGGRADGDGCDADCRFEPEPPAEEGGETGGSEGETGLGPGEGGSFDGINDRGCGCSSGGGAPASVPALLMLLAWRRRRRP